MVLRQTARMVKSSTSYNSFSKKIFSNIVFECIFCSLYILPVVWETWLIIKFGTTAVSYSPCVILYVSIISPLCRRYFSVGFTSLVLQLQLRLGCPCMTTIPQKRKTGTGCWLTQQRNTLSPIPMFTDFGADYKHPDFLSRLGFGLPTNAAFLKWSWYQ